MNTLARPQSVLLDVRRAAAGFAGLPLAGPAAWLGHVASAALHDLLAAAAGAEAAGATPAELREATAPARDLYAGHGGIIAHTQSWPLGYPGDFALIERLLDVRAEGAAGTLAHALDAAVLQLPIVWQHRAKVAWQARLVRGHLRGEMHVRVLSIGCGGSRDLMLLEDHELERLDVTLSDLDAAALALSRGRLQGRVASLAVVPGNALRTVNRLAACGPFDVILVGGLLDYLPARAASLLLTRALAMLAPGGTLGVTNVAAGNPWRLMLQLLCSWPLLERTRDEMLALLAWPGGRVDVSLDDSRLTWLAVARARS